MPSLPVTPINRPTDLNGIANGAIPQRLLLPCGVFSVYEPFPEFYMHHLAARSMRAMVAKMFVDLGITKVEGSSTTRSLAEQEYAFDGTPKGLWDDRYAGRYVPQNLWGAYEATSRKWAKKSNGQPDIKSWQGKLWKRRLGTVGAAVPGTSNHGDGIAIDLAVTTAIVNWLIKNASTFGYSAESQEESWHWRYWAGDNLPAAVLAYEAAHTPPVTVEDNTMQVINKRAYDSRTDRPMNANETRAVQLGITGKAALVNFTLTNVKAPGYLTAWGDGAKPATSVVNAAAGVTVANAVIVPVRADGTIQVFVLAACDVVVDVYAVWD